MTIDIIERDGWFVLCLDSKPHVKFDTRAYAEKVAKRYTHHVTGAASLPFVRIIKRKPRAT